MPSSNWSLVEWKQNTDWLIDWLIDFIIVTLYIQYTFNDFTVQKIYPALRGLICHSKYGTYIHVYMHWVVCSCPACVIVGRHISSGAAQWLLREPSNVPRKIPEMAIKWSYLLTLPMEESWSFTEGVGPNQTCDRITNTARFDLHICSTPHICTDSLMLAGSIINRLLECELWSRK